MFKPFALTAVLALKAFCQDEPMDEPMGETMEGEDMYKEYDMVVGSEIADLTDLTVSGVLYA